MLNQNKLTLQKVELCMIRAQDYLYSVHVKDNHKLQEALALLKDATNIIKDQVELAGKNRL